MTLFIYVYLDVLYIFKDGHSEINIKNKTK